MHENEYVTAHEPSTTPQTHQVQGPMTTPHTQQAQGPVTTPQTQQAQSISHTVRNKGKAKVVGEKKYVRGSNQTWSGHGLYINENSGATIFNVSLCAARRIFLLLVQCWLSQCDDVLFIWFICHILDCNLSM